MLFADRTHKHFFNGGVMTPEKAIALCLSRAHQIDLAIIAESARWGDQRPSRVNNPYTKEDWWKEVDGYLNKTFFPVRTGIVLNQLRNRGLYPQVAAPVFQINGSYQHGGQVAARDTLSMTGGAMIYYTLDGTDPRVPGTTATSAGTSVVLVAENAAKRVLVPTAALVDAWRTDPAFNDSAWISGSGGVGYERSSGYETLFRINVQTQMYNKATSCYIRIPFTVTADTLQGLTSLTLKVRYDDAFVAYLNGVEIQRANFTGTPAWNSAATASCADTDAVNWQPFDISSSINRLHTGTNLLAIQALNDTATSSDFLNSVELSAARGSASGATPAGTSRSAVRYAGPITLSQSTIVKARVLSGTTWSALNEAVYAVGPVAQSLRASELMYHPLETGNPSDPNTEFIELTNIANQGINLSLARFTKGVTYTFPNFDLPAGGYCLVVKDLAAFQAKYGAGSPTQNSALGGPSKLPVVGQYTGSLDNGGERIELVDAMGQIIQSFKYDDGWFKTTDGAGYSLTVKDPRTTDANSLNDKSAWRPSSSIGGSPGRGD
jgi:hypothetical protein